MRALETELGVPVVRRSRQYEGLTAEGEVVLAHAHRLLREAEALRQELHSRDGHRAARCRSARCRPRCRSRRASPALCATPRRHRAGAALAQFAGDRDRHREPVARHGPGLHRSRASRSARALQIWPQYEEAYYVVQRTRGQCRRTERGPPIAWREAAALPLTLLTPDMHNRAIVGGMREAGAEPHAALETNSVLALVAALAAGTWPQCCPVRWSLGGERRRLRAQPFVEPTVRTPIGFMTAARAHHARAARRAATAQDAGWRKRRQRTAARSRRAARASVECAAFVGRGRLTVMSGAASPSVRLAAPAARRATAAAPPRPASAKPGSSPGRSGNHVLAVAPVAPTTRCLRRSPSCPTHCPGRSRRLTISLSCSTSPLVHERADRPSSSKSARSTTTTATSSRYRSRRR